MGLRVAVQLRCSLCLECHPVPRLTGVWLGLAACADCSLAELERQAAALREQEAALGKRTAKLEAEQAAAVAAQQVGGGTGDIGEPESETTGMPKCEEPHGP